MNVNNSFNSSMYGAIFGTGNNANSGMYGIDFSQYASLKNGSYKTALKAYYASDASKKNASTDGTKTASGKDTTQSLTRIQTSAKELSESATTLLAGGKKSVFATEKVKDSSGKEYDSYQYDTDKIYKAVKGFVDSYNSMIENTVSTNTNNIATATAGMINMTDENKGLLASIGISVSATDYKLTLDEDDFKKADMSTVKALFNSTGSYGYQVSAKASMVNYYAQNEITKASNYSGSGNYSYYNVNGSMFNSWT